MNINKEKLRLYVELLSFGIALIISIYWIANSEEVNNNEYLLGLFRGILWPTIIGGYLRSSLR
jgi:hypothetical protein